MLALEGGYDAPRTQEDGDCAPHPEKGDDDDDEEEEDGEGSLAARAARVLAGGRGGIAATVERYRMWRAVQAAKRKQAKDEARKQRERDAERRELRLMQAEEKRTWDAYELNERNLKRMIRENLAMKRNGAHKGILERVERAKLTEEGLLFKHGMVTSFWRWRRSPALRETLHVTPEGSPVYSFAFSKCGRYFATAGEDCLVRIWDSVYLSEKLKTKRRRGSSATSIGSLHSLEARAQADPTLGWRCLLHLEGHVAPVRDVSFHPGFKSPEKFDTEGPFKRGDPPRPAHVLASSSADGDILIWDLSYGSSMCRFRLRAHDGVASSIAFSPDGGRLVSCGWDGQLIAWDAQRGIRLFAYGFGHGSAIMSASFSPSGRYVVTSTNYGERSIKLWHANMPLHEHELERLGFRLRWKRTGTVKRIKINKDPTNFFLTHEEEAEARESSDDSDGESELKKLLAVPPSLLKQRKLLKQGIGLPLEDQDSRQGFSLSVKLIDENGRAAKSESYFRGCKLALILKGTRPFTGFYLGASAAGQDSAVRYGTFFNVGDGNVALSKDRHVAFRSETAECTEALTCQWRAPKNHSVGWLTFKAVFLYPGPSGSPGTLRATTWLTLKEIQAPIPEAIRNSMATVKKPRKRSYSTLERSSQLLEALRDGQWAKASVFFDTSSTLHVPGEKQIRGGRAIISWLQQSIGHHLVFQEPIAVGVAWTSVETSYERREDAISKRTHCREQDSLMELAEQTPGGTDNNDIPKSPAQERETLNAIPHLAESSYQSHHAMRCRPHVGQPRSSKRYSAEKEHCQTSSVASDPELSSAIDKRAALRKRNSLISRAKSEVRYLKGLQKRGTVALPELGYFSGEKLKSRSDHQHHHLKIAPHSESPHETLVSGGEFGADLEGMRMPLPEFYPRDPWIQYDVQGKYCQPDLQQSKTRGIDENVESLVDEALAREDLLRQNATHRRRGGDAFQSDMYLRPELVSPHDGELYEPLVEQEFHEILLRSKGTGGQKYGGDDPHARDRERARRGAIIGEVDAAEPGIDPIEISSLRKDGGLIREFCSPCHQDDINQVAFSPDESALASASSDGVVKVWDINSGVATEILRGHEDAVMSVAWSPRGDFLVSGGADRFVILWSMSSLRLIAKLRGHLDVVHRVTFLPGLGEYDLGTCSSDGTLRTWTTAPQVPRPPPNPRALHIGKTFVTLSWNYPAAFNDELTAFKIRWRRGEDGSYDSQITHPGDSSQIEVRDLLPGSLYHFQVAGLNHMGTGPWSQESDPIITELSIPDPPDQPCVEKVSSRSISISFLVPKPTVPEMKSLLFEVRAAGQGKNFEESQPNEIFWDDALNAGERWVREQSKDGSIELDGRHSRKNFVLMIATVSDLCPGLFYRLNVTAVNNVGRGDASPPTFSCMTQPEVPPKPDPPELKAANPTSLTVSWSSGSDGGSAVRGYHIKLIAQAVGMVVDRKCSHNCRIMTFDALEKGCEFRFLMRASNNIGYSEWSDESPIFRTSSEVPDKPDKPKILSMEMTTAVIEINHPSCNGDDLTDIFIGIRSHESHAAPNWSRV